MRGEIFLARDEIFLTKQSVHYLAVLINDLVSSFELFGAFDRLH